MGLGLGGDEVAAPGRDVGPNVARRPLEQVLRAAQTLEKRVRERERLVPVAAELLVEHVLDVEPHEPDGGPVPLVPPARFGQRLRRAVEVAEAPQAVRQVVERRVDHVRCFRRDGELDRASHLREAVGISFGRAGHAECVEHMREELVVPELLGQRQRPLAELDRAVERAVDREVPCLLNEHAHLRERERQCLH